MKPFVEHDCIALKTLGFTRRKPEPKENPEYVQYRIEVTHPVLDNLSIEVDGEHIHVYCREGSIKQNGTAVLIKLSPFSIKAVTKLLKDLNVNQ